MSELGYLSRGPSLALKHLRCRLQEIYFRCDLDERVSLLRGSMSSSGRAVQPAVQPKPGLTAKRFSAGHSRPAWISQEIPDKREPPANRRGLVPIGRVSTRKVEG